MVSRPKRLATAEFTKEMVKTLEKYFDDYQVDGVVRLDVTDKGLWLPVPGQERRKFLGSVSVFDDPSKFRS